MKNTLLILLALGWLSINSIAVAQQPATITKGEVVDTLCNNTRLSVEIISTGDIHYDHPQHPATGIICPFVRFFETTQSFSWYQWESSFFDPTNSDVVRAEVNHSGYIKVTVGDNYGHTGSDSIWFNVRNSEVPPMENFIMEIDDDLHANFYGIATEEHHRLRLSRSYDHMHYINIYDSFLSNGEWSYVDTNVIYSDDSLWLYKCYIYDICGSYTVYKVAGILCTTTLHDYGQWYINIKSSIPTSEFVYFIYSIDENGHRHHFVDENGNPVTLPYWTTSWQIPAPHIDPYYQIGVGRQLEDGSYVLLSLSNKVPNPWPDSDGINDENDETSFSIFPNPTNGHFTAVGTGVLSIWNPNGQKIFQKEVDGEISINLTAGIYISSLSTKHGNYHKKIVVY